MLKRTLTALVGIALFLFLSFWGSIPFLLGITGVALVCAYEWTSAYRHALKASGITPTGGFLQAVLPFCGAVYPLGLQWRLHQEGFSPLFPSLLVAAPVPFFALLTLRAALTGKALGGLQRSYGLVGAIYISSALSGFVLLRLFLSPNALQPPLKHSSPNAWLLLWPTICVWASDSMALFAGKTFGRHKLAPSLSPGKTWEGAFAGLLAALLIGMGLAYWYALPLTLGGVIGAIAGIAGPWGDLWESALKRELGIKDFGRLLPGHGGLLDRFDSLFFVVPLFSLLWAIWNP